MNSFLKSVYMRGMAAADIAGIIDAKKVAVLLEERHPLGGKKHRISAEIKEDNLPI